MLTSAQCRAARGLLALEPATLARAQAEVGLVSEQLEGHAAQARRRANRSYRASQSAAAGVEFIDENGGGPGLRLRKRATGK